MSVFISDLRKRFHRKRHVFGSIVGVPRIEYEDELAEDFVQEQNNKKKTWSVCFHLSHQENLVDYYLGSGLIVILSGKCLCQGCYERVVSGGDIKDFSGSCRMLTDLEMQNILIDPMLQINRETFSSCSQQPLGRQGQCTWVSCPHISSFKELEILYTRCYPIFLNEGYVSCEDCVGKIPTPKSLTQTLLGCESMTDQSFQKKIIDRLFLINLEVLESVGHYKR